MTLGRLLALLGEGISAEALETQLAAMQAEHLLDPSTAAAARSLNARLREASRREGLLRVLYDTATDLTGIRDVEAVLKAIVRRTRSLIGSDIAYLSLNDYDSGESYIRVTDGAATALFRNIRMPLGEGVLGAVATGEAPSQSADYLVDQTKSHLESSDAAVAAEGVTGHHGRSPCGPRARSSVRSSWRTGTRTRSAATTSHSWNPSAPTLPWPSRMRVTSPKWPMPWSGWIRHSGRILPM